jgi:HEAT repeat protein
VGSRSIGVPGCVAVLVAAAGCSTAYVPPDPLELVSRINGSEDDAVRAAAVSGLAELGVLRRFRLDPDEALRLTRDSSPVVRARALALFLEDRRLPAELGALLEDDDPDVRAAAVNLMSRRCLSGGTAALARFLARREEGASARCLAADALAATGDPAAWGPLEGALDDGSADVRARSARAIGTLWARRDSVGEPDEETLARAVEALTRMLADASPAARLQAVKVLAATGGSGRVPGMEKAIGEELGWRRLAMLGRFADEARPPALPFLRGVYDDPDEPWSARYAAARGLYLLGEIGRAEMDLAGGRAVRRAFAEQGTFADADLFAAGWRPTWVRGSRFAGTLAPEGPEQLQVLWRMKRERADLVIAGALSTLEENRTGRRARLELAELGYAREKPFATDPLRQKRRLLTAFFHGPSVGRFDFAPGPNEYAVGWFWRAGLNFRVWGRAGLDVYVDAHAWLEGRNRDWHLAGAGAVGVNLIIRH